MLQQARAIGTAGLLNQHRLSSRNGQGRRGQLRQELARPLRDAEEGTLQKPPGNAGAQECGVTAEAQAVPLEIGAAVLATAFLVGISRCYLGVHYPGDVLVGWALAGLAFLSKDPALQLFSSLPR